MSSFIGKTNEQGQTIIIRRDEEHLPHVEVSWYDGGIGGSGVCAVRPGESQEEAAQRAFPGKKSRPNWTVRDIALH